MGVQVRVAEAVDAVGEADGHRTGDPTVGARLVAEVAEHLVDPALVQRDDLGTTSWVDREEHADGLRCRHDHVEGAHAVWQTT